MRRVRIYSLLGTVLLLVGCAPVARPKLAPSLVTDRPDFTESSATIPVGMAQVEAGYTASRIDAYKEHTIGETLVRIGTSTRSEFRLALNSYAVTSDPTASARGIEDAAIGAKFRIRDGAEHFSLLQPEAAVLFATSLPTGAAAFRTNALQPEMKLAAGWPVTSKLGFATNANVALPVENGERFTEGSASGSFGYEVNDRVGAYAEWFAFFRATRFGGQSHHVNAGFTVGFGDNLQLDIRAGVNPSRPGKDAFIGAGFARRVGRVRP